MYIRSNRTSIYIYVKIRESAKMRKSVWVKVISMSLMIMLMIPGQVVFGATTSFRFDKDKVNAKTNEVFSMGLKGEALTDLYGFEIALSFDAAKIEIVGKPSVKSMEGFTAGPTRGSDGKVYFGFTQIGKKSGKSGNIDLGEFTFKAKQPGVHTIRLESVKVVDSKMKSKDYKVGQVMNITAVGGDKAGNLADIKGHWAEGCITQVVNAEYMVGKAQNQFKPNDKLIRAEMATVLSRLVETTGKGSNPFEDIKGHEWYAQNIISMSDKGLIKGYEDKTFKPKNNITRAETMVILGRMAKENKTYKKPENIDKVLSVYKDQASVPTWAKEEIAWAIESGLIKGDESGKLGMKNNITRAEASVILCRLLGLEQH